MYIYVHTYMNIYLSHTCILQKSFKNIFNNSSNNNNDENKNCLVIYVNNSETNNNKTTKINIK